MFRVKKSFLGGNLILQQRVDNQWKDAKATPQLLEGFRIVSDDFMALRDIEARIQDERIRELEEELFVIHDTRSRAAKAGWAKKRGANQSIYTTRRTAEKKGDD